MRALRATTAVAGGHITKNLWRSVAICAVLAVVAALLMKMRAFGMVALWADGFAFFVCTVGILVMLQSQVGYVSPHAPPPEEV
jgi:ABC-type glycerol-3-phosphate transport system permease component